MSVCMSVNNTRSRNFVCFSWVNGRTKTGGRTPPLLLHQNRCKMAFVLYDVFCSFFAGKICGTNRLN